MSEEVTYPSIDAMKFTATALVITDRPARYGKQLASHMGHKLTVVEIEGGYRLTFNRDGNFGGYGDLISRENGLEMTVYALTAEGAQRVADVLDRHLVRFGERDDLVVNFSEPQAR